MTHEEIRSDFRRICPNIEQHATKKYLDELMSIASNLTTEQRTNVLFKSRHLVSKGLCAAVRQTLIDHKIIKPQSPKPILVVYVFFPELLLIADGFDADFHSDRWWGIEQSHLMHTVKLKRKVLYETINYIDYANTERDRSV